MAANSFLLSHPPVHGPHNEHCFCVRCRNSEVDRLMQRRNLTTQELHRILFTELTQTRETILDTQFEHTKQEVIVGYCYKQRCLAGTGYVSFGHWLANAPDMAHLSPLERDRICDKKSYHSKHACHRCSNLLDIPIIKSGWYQLVYEAKRQFAS